MLRASSVLVVTSAVISSVVMAVLDVSWDCADV